MDVYRSGKNLVLWIKTPDDDLRYEVPYRSYVYLEDSPVSIELLERNRIAYIRKQRRTYLRKWKSVLEVSVAPNNYERFVRWVEKETRYRLRLYNADIIPEQMFLFEKNIAPCSTIELRDGAIIAHENQPIPLVQAEIRIIRSGQANDVPITAIFFDQNKISGSEKEVLEEFTKRFKQKEPDVVIVEHAFRMMPHLMGRLAYHEINCPLHRWDATELKYKGGKSFWSYGRVQYRDFAVRLHGRFLMDSYSTMGLECKPDAIVELCQLTGALFQQTASRSFGAAFQMALIRQMLRERYIVPYKEKPVDTPLSMQQLLKADRGGQYLDTQPGYHANVAEIDFSSMFPWLIYNHNISAETILSDDEPSEHVPHAPIKISLRHKGIVPLTIKPLIDRRMHYKKHPSAINKAKAAGLKWVLVTSYGYLRYREFKLGIPSSHMAVCGYARETLLDAMKVAEEKGYEIIHGIVDSLYVTKKGMTENDVLELCREIELQCGIPISFEGIFRWICFLNSVVDEARPIPARYYGVFENGSIKARGIEVQQRSAPLVVKYLQQKCIESLRDCTSKEEMIGHAHQLLRIAREIMLQLPTLDAKWLQCDTTIGTTNYAHNIPQKIIVEKLKKKGIEPMPGQRIQYVFVPGGVTLPEDYQGKPDAQRYQRLFCRALYNLLQPFGFTKEKISKYMQDNIQTTLIDYLPLTEHVYVESKKSTYEDLSTIAKTLEEKNVIEQK